MTDNQKIECLTMLARLQARTSKIELSIGFTDDNGIVNHDFIVIKDCPQLVIEQLIKNNFLVSVSKRGLIVDKI